MKAIFLNERDARVGYLDILNEARKGQELALEQVVLLGTDAWSGMLAGGVDVPALTQTPEDVVNIQYTSGTTGSPKGVLLTHRNLVNNAYVVGREMMLTGADRLCSPVPLYHCFGCVMSSLLAIVHGIALVLPAAQFDPLATLQAIDAERCTLIYGSAGDAAGDRCGAVYTDLRRAHHVHRGTGASGFPQVQYGHAAERDYGGRAVSGGGDEAGRLGDELQRDERGLWPDGKLSGDHDVGGRR